MLNSALFRFIITFFVCLIGLTENNMQAQSHKINWGVRLGLNAVSITSYKAFQTDEVLTNSSFTNENGYLINGFARFNFNRIFLQPELSWNNYHRICSFSLPIENNSDYYPSVDLKIHSQAINTNLLIGYNIVHDYPFLFGVYAGASAIGTYRTDYSMDIAEPFLKKDLLLNYSGILGVSINISKLYFDLRYEATVPINYLNLNDIPSIPNNYQNVLIKRTESFLSFSVGVMF